MIKWIYIVASVLCSLSASSQETFMGTSRTELALGSKWTYESKNHPTSFVGFQEYEIVDTTTWHGKKALVIEPGLFDKQDYLLSKNNKVYFWDDDLGEYQLNYDFENDTSYYIRYMNQGSNQADSTLVLIDSVKIEYINGVNHTVQYCRSTLGYGNIARPFRIINKIGSTYAGPRLVVGSVLDNITNDIQRIRCYESNTAQYTFTEVSCDSTWRTTNTYDIESNEPMLYPNPTTGKVWINGGDQEIEYEVYNLNGSLISNGSTRDKSLILTQDGLQLLRFKIKDNWVWARMVKL